VIFEAPGKFNIVFLKRIKYGCFYGVRSKSFTMNESKIIRNWDNIKRRLKEHYKVLTEKDVAYMEGKEEVLFDNLQKKIGISRKELIYLLYLYISDTD
jgi:CRISPR/Cas system CMR-associated protein Cmr3 (group 5 of RAMP superfamily)